MYKGNSEMYRIIENVDYVEKKILKTKYFLIQLHTVTMGYRANICEMTKIFIP